MRFEKLVSGQTAVTCPGCGGEDVARALSLFGVKSGSTFTASAGGGGCGCGAGGCGCH
jgi:hypothetical protein